MSNIHDVFAVKTSCNLAYFRSQFRDLTQFDLLCSEPEICGGFELEKMHFLRAKPRRGIPEDSLSDLRLPITKKGNRSQQKPRLTAKKTVIHDIFVTYGN